LGRRILFKRIKRNFFTQLILNRALVFQCIICETCAG
jgi:hypothetical protein